MNISPLAYIEEGAHIGSDVVIGPERQYVLDFIRSSDRGIIAGNIA